MIFGRKQPRLYLESLEQEEPQNKYSDRPSGFYRATTNLPLWLTPGERFNARTVTLERVLAAAGVHLDPEQRRGVTEPNQIWLTQFNPKPDVPPLSDFYLNSFLHGDSKPSVRITRSTEQPGMLIAHRTETIGPYALGLILDNPYIQDAVRARTNEQSFGGYLLYPASTLLMALVRPDASMRTAQAGLRDCLTL